MNYELAVQTAVYNQLKSSSELADLVGDKIYDHVPQKSEVCGKTVDSPFPYITIGEDINTEWSVFEKSGNDTTFVIHTWSRQRGRKELKEIQGAIRSALDRAELTYPDVCFVTCDFQGSSSDFENDTLTYHGISEFRILIR